MPRIAGGPESATMLRARAYILQHPDETKEQQVVGSGTSARTIARSRAVLITEGLLPADRKTPTHVTVGKQDATGGGAESLRDHAAMKALAAIVELSDDDIDDRTVQKRLLKMCLGFSFNPDLHPDTRMSAAQMWNKLRDQSKARELGPGKPTTFEGAVARLSALLSATGLNITLAALTKSFPEVLDAQNTDDQAAAPSGPPPAPVEARHEGEAQENDDLRPVHLEGGDPPRLPDPGHLGSDDLSGPPA